MLPALCPVGQSRLGEPRTQAANLGKRRTPGQNGTLRE